MTSLNVVTVSPVLCSGPTNFLRKLYLVNRPIGMKSPIYVAVERMIAFDRLCSMCTVRQGQGVEHARLQKHKAGMDHALRGWHARPGLWFQSSLGGAGYRSRCASEFHYLKYIYS